MLYAVEPTLASELERGTIIRGGCQNLRVTKVTLSDHRILALNTLVATGEVECEEVD